jgi:hypothetical protein
LEDSSVNAPDPTIVHICARCAAVTGIEEADTAGHICASAAPTLYLALRLRLFADAMNELAAQLERPP